MQCNVKKEDIHMKLLWSILRVETEGGAASTGILRTQDNQQILPGV